jgi:hypothetical protein
MSVINVPPFPSLDVAKLPAMYWLRRATSGEETGTPDGDPRSSILTGESDVSDVEIKAVDVEIEVQTPLEAKPTMSAFSAGMSPKLMFANSRG